MTSVDWETRSVTNNRARQRSVPECHCNDCIMNRPCRGDSEVARMGYNNGVLVGAEMAPGMIWSTDGSNRRERDI